MFKKYLNENFIRFDNPRDNRWFSIMDVPYDELPDGDYEDKEYSSYDEFVTDFPEHRHFSGTKPENLDSSRRMFDNYKKSYGPLKGRISRTTSNGQTPLAMESKSKQPMKESKIVKKKDLDVLIESTLEKAGIETPKKKVVTENKIKTEVLKESTKEVISEDFKNELAKFNKLTNFKYKY